MAKPRGMKLVYPERRHCFVCRRTWAFALPIHGLYCSPECAGRPEIPMELRYGELIPPRCCRNRLRVADMQHGVVRVTWTWKKRYIFERDAIQAVKDSRMVSWYYCDHCWYWHVSTKEGKYNADERAEQ